MKKSLQIIDHGIFSAVFEGFGFSVLKARVEEKLMVLVRHNGMDIQDFTLAQPRLTPGTLDLP